MAEPPTTEDGHHVVINGRKWRATDPSIPVGRRAELTRILMSWRREVRRTKGTDEERVARAGVQAPGGPLPRDAPVREHRGDHPYPGNGERTEHA